MTTDDNTKSAKISCRFYCELCDFGTCKKYNYDVHLESIKHKNNGLTTNNNKNKQQISKNIIHCLICEKIFNDRAGLWRHKKKCTIVSEEKPIKIDNEPSEKELIMILIKENCELKNMMMEVIKTGTHNTNNTTNTHSHNKAFNLNFFLNETCKDAMNITDFVNSIQLQLSDLERVGELGYVDGISNIIMKNLKKLDVTKRPVHCTDKKREVLYVKDEDKWEKENAENKIIRKAVKKVSHKNILMLSKFKDAHPDCSKSDSKYSDQYNKIMIESFGGSGDDDSKKEDKIIKNISKTIVIERETEPL